MLPFHSPQVYSAIAGYWKSVCFDFTIRHTVKSDGCSALDYIECGGLVAACAVSCVDPADGVCEACLGTAYSKCVGCVTLTNKINAVHVQTAPGNATHY